ncbi:MAG: hypothetical protein HOB84_10865 [Candidatus Marinimicrobia bacterium]|jgi:hypothetical protein|nr:hypothetical protein [Candidatus Neomarinimicrobiota bacterium]MBT4033565.1 hypothetical protein [Candidatus Neomarinimicrobiota bacterium]MBT4360212.1 hypothetical protein [Candidatus Neomarinimicrobiota bacterium]MBT4715264.1 hypothetical protein [Candidatus Neomarinimicrobiota bacterium]MBT4947907.1 hypothetical protein [Candidatus Neomarinimicrobiota bacterium]
MEEMIPISMFLSAAAIIIVALFLKLQKRKIESTEILAAIEKGVEVKFPDVNRNRLLPGLIWLFLGIIMTLGMALAIPEDAPSGMWVWGLIPAAVGAAYLIVYRIDEQKGDSEEK